MRCTRIGLCTGTSSVSDPKRNPAHISHRRRASNSRLSKPGKHFFRRGSLSSNDTRNLLVDCNYRAVRALLVNLLWSIVSQTDSETRYWFELARSSSSGKWGSPLATSGVWSECNSYSWFSVEIGAIAYHYGHYHSRVQRGCFMNKFVESYPGNGIFHCTSRWSNWDTIPNYMNY